MLDDIVGLIYIAILIGLTAFFVISEFAIVKVRVSRIDELVEEGNKKAIAAKKVIENLDEYLSACQLGITVTALGIGWLGESTFRSILSSTCLITFTYQLRFLMLLSITLAFLIMTFLHVVVGELAPKTIAIQKAEKVTLLFAGRYMVLPNYVSIYWLLNGSARLVVTSFRLKPASEGE